MVGGEHHEHTDGRRVKLWWKSTGTTDSRLGLVRKRLGEAKALLAGHGIFHGIEDIFYFKVLIFYDILYSVYVRVGMIWRPAPAGTTRHQDTRKPAEMRAFLLVAD